MGWTRSTVWGPGDAQARGASKRIGVLSRWDDAEMETQLVVAVITNVVTVIALLVTQFTSQRNEGRRLTEARTARLSAARREVYIELVQRCDEIVRATDDKQRRSLGWDPTPADLYPEYEGVIESSLQRRLSEVELMGDAVTIEAARALVKAVSDYQYTEKAMSADRATEKRSAFMSAARRDLDTN